MNVVDRAGRHLGDRTIELHLAMTGFPEVSFLKKAKKEGADSFIYKNTSLEETKQVIVSTYRGYSVFPSEKISDENRFLLNLSAKEMEVLRYVCEGYDRKEIAEAMFNSENTIKSYIRSILNKTGYDSIAKLAIYAVSHDTASDTEDGASASVFAQKIIIELLFGEVVPNETSPLDHALPSCAQLKNRAHVQEHSRRQKGARQLKKSAKVMNELPIYW